MYSQWQDKPEVEKLSEIRDLDHKLKLEHSYSDSSNLIGQFEVPYFHSDTIEGTTCSALALRAWLFYM